MFDFIFNNLYDHSLLIPGVIAAMVVHELAHAAAAYALGDRRPELRAQFTLNPLRHVTWIGVLLFFLLGLGWSRPLRADPAAYRHPNRAIFVIALVGPAANVAWSAALFGASLLSAALALAALPPETLRGPVLGFFGGQGMPPAASALVAMCTFHAAEASILLALINLVPLPFFDGFWALFAAAHGVWQLLRRGRAAAVSENGRAPALASRSLPLRPSSPGSAMGVVDLFREGARLQAGRKWAQAAEVYQRVLERDPRHRAAAYSLGQVYERMGNRYEAARAYGRAYVLSGGDEERTQAAARLDELGVTLADAIAVQQGQAPAAGALAPAVEPPEATSSPSAEGARPRRRIGWQTALIALGTAGIVAVLYLGVFPMLAVQSVSGEFFLDRLAAAEAALDAGDGAGAEAALGDALDLADGVYTQPALTAARAEAARRVPVLAARLPLSRAAGVLEALVELDAGRSADALWRLQAMPEQGDFAVQLYTASAFIERGQWDSAEAALHTAVQLRPEDVVAHSNLAFVFYRLGKYADARDEGQSALLLDAQFAHAWKTMALLCLQPGVCEDRDMAYGYAFIATFYAPGLASAHDALSRALAVYGQADLAAAEQREAERLDTGEYSAYY